MAQNFECAFCTKWIDKASDAWAETEQFIYDPTYAGWTRKIKVLAHTACIDQERRKREERHAQWLLDEVQQNQERRQRRAARRERRRQWWRNLPARLKAKLRAGTTAP